MRPSFGPPLPRLEQCDALRRAAACERPHAAQRKNVGPTALSISSLVSETFEIPPAAPLPSAGCPFSVGPISLCVTHTCEGARSRRATGPALTRATLPREARFGKAVVTFAA